MQRNTEGNKGHKMTQGDTRGHKGTQGHRDTGTQGHRDTGNKRTTGNTGGQRTKVT